MKNRKDFIERRKHNRLRVKEGGFAMIMSAPANLGQIEDMSMGEIA
ncbi:MAG: PilZ domain-containing protein, partial [Deltaproteobacteria bacterium]|nr:PilZ domain-containing protein [Deltaproteobacteria bacterium]